MPLTDAASCGLVFYTHPMSRGQIARWMLEETGADYRQVLLDYGGSMRAPEYLAVNPMGKVPAIVHGGRVVTECAAICAYLADAFPAAGLAPPPAERADYYRWMFFAAGPLEMAVTHKALGVEVAAERQGMLGYGTLERTLDTLAHAVSKHEFIAGDDFSAADVYVGSHIAWGLQFGTIPERDEFREYAGRLSVREAWKRARAIDQALGRADD